jgi:rhamnulokinase
MGKVVTCIAFDLGASGGRTVLGHFDGNRLSIEEIHRFPNGPVRVGRNIYWDALRLLEEVKHGLAFANRVAGESVTSIGLDTWGIDFALLDRDGRLVGNPHSYRDPRTDGMMEAAFRRVPRDEIYGQTGVQFMQLNTLYQLLAMVVNESPQLEVAETLLMIPDLFNYWLTGQKVCEFTDATTTQFYNPVEMNWARSLLERMGIPTHILPEIAETGANLGPVRPWLTEETGIGQVPVIAVATHDTASATSAIPSSGNDHAFISCGTWSLVGAKATEAVINEHGLAYSFACYGGAGGQFLVWKNVQGLWLLQECIRVWAEAGKDYAYDDVVRLAREATPFESFVDTDDRSFLTPGDMPTRIRAFCEQTGQIPPKTDGAVARCIIESLALKHRWALNRLEKVMGKSLDPVHVIGGGCKNSLLAQMTADASGRTVITGPVEATAIGNIMIQLLALGHVSSLEEGTEVIGRSFDSMVYEPHRSAAWDDAYERFLDLI